MIIAETFFFFYNAVQEDADDGQDICKLRSLHILKSGRSKSGAGTW